MNSYFGSTFWGQPIPESFNLNMENEDLNVEQLLDHDGLLDQIKKWNPRVVDFFAQKRSNLKKLIEISLVEGPKDNVKRAFNYPMIANEIFQQELTPIIDLFFTKFEQVQYPQSLQQIQINEQILETSSNRIDEQESCDMTSEDATIQDLRIQQITDKQKQQLDEDDYNIDTDEFIKIEQKDEIQEKNDKKQKKKRNVKRRYSGCKTIYTVKIDLNVENPINDKQKTNIQIMDQQTDQQQNQMNKNSQNDQSQQIIDQETQINEQQLQQIELKSEEQNDQQTQLQQFNEQTLQNDNKIQEQQDQQQNNMNLSNIQQNQINDSIQQKQQDNYEVLDYFLSFLNNKDQLNQTISSYFYTIFQSLIKKRPVDLINYLLQREYLLDEFFYHISDISIAEALQNILAIDNIKFESKDSNLKDLRNKQIQRIFDLFLESDNIDNIQSKSKLRWPRNKLYLIYIKAIMNCHKIICSIFQNYSIIWDGREMVEMILKPHNCQKLFEKLNAETNFKSKFILELIQLKLKYYLPYEYDTQVIDEFSNYLTQYSIKIKKSYDHISFVNIFIENLNILQEKLEFNNEKQTSQNGEYFKPISQFRIKIVEIIITIIKLNSDKLNQKLFESTIFAQLFELFFQQQWNNIYHQSIVSLIKVIFEKKFTLYINHLFHEINIQQLIIIKSQDILEKGKTDYTKGYLGHLIQIGNLINQYADQFKDLIIQDEKWTEYCQNFLLQNNIKQNRDLAGVNITDCQKITIAASSEGQEIKEGDFQVEDDEINTINKIENELQSIEFKPNLMNYESQKNEETCFKDHSPVKEQLQNIQSQFEYTNDDYKSPPKNSSSFHESNQLSLISSHKHRISLNLSSSQSSNSSFSSLSSLFGNKKVKVIMNKDKKKTGVSRKITSKDKEFLSMLQDNVETHKLNQSLQSLSNCSSFIEDFEQNQDDLVSIIKEQQSNP